MRTCGSYKGRLVVSETCTELENLNKQLLELELTLDQRFSVGNFAGLSGTPPPAPMRRRARVVSADIDA